MNHLLITDLTIPKTISVACCALTERHGREGGGQADRHLRVEPWWVRLLGRKRWWWSSWNWNSGRRDTVLRESLRERSRHPVGNRGSTFLGVWGQTYRGHRSEASPCKKDWGLFRCRSIPDCSRRCGHRSTKTTATFFSVDVYLSFVMREIDFFFMRLLGTQRYPVSVGVDGRDGWSIECTDLAQRRARSRRALLGTDETQCQGRNACVPGMSCKPDWDDRTRSGSRRRNSLFR